MSSATSERRRRRWLIARVLLACILLSLLVTWAGVGRLLEAASMASAPELALALALTVAALALNAVGTHGVARPFGARFGSVCRHTASAFALGALTPGRVGELSLAFFLRSEGVPTPEGVALVVVSRAVILSLLAVFALPITAALGEGSEVGHWLAAFGLSALLVIALIACPGAFFGLASRLPVLSRARADDLRAMRGRPRAAEPPILMWILLVQLGRILLLFATSHVLFRSVGAQVSYADVATINAVARVVALAPVSIGGLGVREGVQVVLFEEISGIAPGTTLAVALFTNGITYGLAALFLMAFGHSETSEVPSR